MAVEPGQIAEAMYEMVRECAGKKQLKPDELSKAMIEKFGAECSRKLCKEAIRLLIDSERCVYTYYGGSFIELPRREGGA